MAEEEKKEEQPQTEIPPEEEGGTTAEQTETRTETVAAASEKQGSTTSFVEKEGERRGRGVEEEETKRKPGRPKGTGKKVQEENGLGGGGPRERSEAERRNEGESRKSVTPDTERSEVKAPEKVSDQIDEESFDTLLKVTNTLTVKIEKLNKLLEKETAYAQALKERADRLATEQENTLLKTTLKEDREKVTAVLNEIRNEVETTSDILEGKEAILEEKYLQLENLNQNVEKIAQAQTEDIRKIHKAFSDIMENKILEFSKNMTAVSKGELTAIKDEVKELLEGVNQRLTDVQNYVINFLRVCEDQNQSLIDKVPEKKRKAGPADVAYFALGGVCIVCLAIQTWMAVRG